MMDTGTMGPAMRELRAAVEECDRLGFDRVHDAINAVLSHDDFAQRWECTTRLIAAVGEHKRARAATFPADRT